MAASALEVNAPDHVVDAVRGLPPDRVYENVQEVWHDLGGSTEAPSRRW